MTVTFPDPHPLSPAGVEHAHALWADSQTFDDVVLTDLLAAAWSSCAAFLPVDELAQPLDDLRTARWTMANVLHARDLWVAYRRDGDVLGFDTYAVRVRPLSDTVKAQLRPQRGRPLVG